MQVVESRIRIVIIPSVSQGIPQCNVACAGDRVAVGIGDGQELAPRVIIILCNQCAGGVPYLVELSFAVVGVGIDISRGSSDLRLPRRVASRNDCL